MTAEPNGNGTAHVWRAILSLALLAVSVLGGFAINTVRDRLDRFEQRQFEGQQRLSRLEADVAAMKQK